MHITQNDRDYNVTAVILGLGQADRFIADYEEIRGSFQ